MDVTSAKAICNSSGALVEHDRLFSQSPLSCKSPVVQPEIRRQGVGVPLISFSSFGRCEVVGARVAEIGLGRPEIRPVGCRFRTDPLDGHELCADVVFPRLRKELLNDLLGFFVSAFAELTMTNFALRVDEVERRPILVVEDSVPVFFILLPVLGFFTNGVFSLFTVWLPEMFPSTLRGSGSGFAFSLGRLLGATGPALIGVLAAATGSLSLAISILAAIYVAGASHSSLCRLRLPGDRSPRDAILSDRVSKK
jgi:hypothetical protein